MITREEFDLYRKIDKKIYEIADTWHQHAFTYGKSGYSTSKPRLESWSDGDHIMFYRQATISGVGYYNPEEIRIDGGAKYLFDDTNLIEDAKQHLADKIKREESRQKSDEERLRILENNRDVQDYIRIKNKHKDQNFIWPPFRIGETI